MPAPGGAVVDRVRAQRHEVRRLKGQLATTRRDLQRAAADLRRLEDECRQRGIVLEVVASPVHRSPLA